MSFRQNVLDQLGQARQVLITSHQGYDDDALASVLTLYGYIKHIFPELSVTVALEDKPSTHREWLPYFKKLKFVESLRPLLEHADLSFWLDGHNLTRFSSRLTAEELRYQNTFCIDHHPGEPDSWQHQLIDPTAAATTQLLAEKLILPTKDDQLKKKLARLLLTGILGDTGTLLYTTPRNSRVLKVVEQLIQIGQIELEPLTIQMNSFTDADITILQELLENQETLSLKGSMLTYSYLPYSFAERFDRPVIKTATGHYQQMFLRRIKGAPWGFVTTPGSQGEWHISFRSQKDAPHVGLLAEEYFSGGGHPYAAGGEIKLPDSQKNSDALTVCQTILEIIAAAKLTPATQSNSV